MISASALRPIVGELSQWHSSGGDPIYAVSSNVDADHAVPVDVVKRAIANLKKMLPGLAARVHGWTARDERAARHMIRVMSDAVARSGDMKLGLRRTKRRATKRSTKRRRRSGFCGCGGR